MSTSQSSSVRHPRLLITGIAGFLGQHLARVAAEAGWDVCGVVRQHGIAGYNTVRADLAEPGAAIDAIERLSPDAVVHAAANARTNECERYPEAAWRDNVRATELLALACASGTPGPPFVVCSTDLVFDGERPGGMYTEDDLTNPINVYGRSKRAMEERLAELGSHAVIARLPLLFGPPATTDAPGSFLGGWIDQLKSGRELVLFTDEWRTPLSAREAARGVLAAVEKGRPGVCYHLAGPQRISRHELGKAFAHHAERWLGFDAGLIRPGLRADVPMPAPRAADVSLDGSRANAELGFSPAPLDGELAWTARVMAEI